MLHLIASLDEGAGLLMFSGKKLLVLKRSKKVDDPKTWGIPGGHREKDDIDLYATARREAIEELGAVPQYTIVGEIEVKNGNKLFTGVLTRTDHHVIREWAPILNKEHTAYKWASLEWLMDNVNDLHGPIKYMIAAGEIRKRIKKEMS